MWRVCFGCRGTVFDSRLWRSSSTAGLMSTCSLETFTPMMWPHCWRLSWESCQSRCSHTDTFMRTLRYLVGMKTIINAFMFYNWHAGITMVIRRLIIWIYSHLYCLYFLPSPRYYLVWWTRQQDCDTQQGAANRGPAASFPALTPGQPLAAQTTARPALPHCQTAGQEQDVCLQPGSYVCSTCSVAQTCENCALLHFTIMVTVINL